MTDIATFDTPAVRTVTAFFDTSDHAATAKTDLIAAGVSADAIVIVGSEAPHFSVEEDRHHGFWAALADWFMPDGDRRTYAEGLRRGGFALSVKTDAGLYARIIDVLDRDGAIDLDEREMSWRDDGWRHDDVPGSAPIDAAYLPAGAGTAGFGASHAGEDGLGHLDEAAGAQRTADRADTRPADAEELVTRRDFDHGRSRVRSFIVEGDVNR